MTDRDRQGSRNPHAKVEPETLELRARPQPVTRINRKVVIGAAAVLLCLISFIVLLALEPPSLRVAAPRELFNVEQKPITDALSKLPASYDGLRPDKKADARKQVTAGPPAPLKVPSLKAPLADAIADAERMENARLARLAAEARKSSVFFRLQLKAAPKEALAAGPRPKPAPRPPPAATDGGLATLSALRAADRALALAGGDADLIGATISAADQTRKLTFLKSGPEKEVYNPHALQTPASPYQLMAGTIIAASLVTGLNSIFRVSSSPRSPSTSTTPSPGASCSSRRAHGWSADTTTSSPSARSAPSSSGSRRGTMRPTVTLGRCSGLAGGSRSRWCFATLT